MKEIPRIALRIIGIAAVLVGVIGLILPFKNYDENHNYQVTVRSRRDRSIISERNQGGAELMKEQRQGAVLLIGCGAFFIYGSRKQLW